jgi:hypothetical protein
MTKEDIKKALEQAQANYEEEITHIAMLAMEEHLVPYLVMEGLHFRIGNGLWTIFDPKKNPKENRDATVPKEDVPPEIKEVLESDVNSWNNYSELFMWMKDFA